MVIETAATKQKALNGFSVQGLISIKEVDALCRRHHNHVVSAPARIGVLAGAKIRTVLTVQTFQSHYRSFAVRSQGRFHGDLSQLQISL